jgi:signal transduction histidine kinase
MVVGSPRNPQQGDDRKGVATLAHEFNNPLAALMNIFYLIEAGNSLTPDGQRYLDLAKAEVGHLSAVAQSALTEFQGKEVWTKADICALLHSVVDFYSTGFHAQGISIDSHCCDPQHLSIHAPSMRQAFSNLLLNAAEAMKEGGKIQVRISSGQERNGALRKGLRITIADNGTGISTADLAKIFDPFFTTKGTAGTGMGLAFVQETIAKHGGSVRVRSCLRPGRTGSVFSMFLPSP